MTIKTQLHPQFIVDETGNRTSVILPFGEFEELLEDLEDLAVSAERRKEAFISHGDLTAELKRDGLLPD
jgi:hypothetical protein